MADTAIIATPDTECEARARRELTSYIAVKLGMSGPVVLAYYANCPLDVLWRLALSVYSRTRVRSGEV